MVWLQVGFGSGFKCNSAVGKALRRVKSTHAAWEHVIGREDQAVNRFKQLAAEAEAALAKKQTQAQQARPAEMIVSKAASC